MKPLIRKCVPPSGSFSCISNSFSYEKFCAGTCFETEAHGYSGMIFGFIDWVDNADWPP